MDRRYYYLDDGKKVGPINQSQLNDLHLPQDTLVWYYGLSDWTPLKNTDALSHGSSALNDSFQDFKKNLSSQRKSFKDWFEGMIARVKSLNKKTDRMPKESHVERPESAHKKSKMIAVSSVCAILIGIAVLFIVITTKSDYPEYITRFPDKFKWFFALPNNTLCEESIEMGYKSKNMGLKELSNYYFDVAYKAKPSDKELIRKLAAIYQDELHNYKKSTLLYMKIYDGKDAEVIAQIGWGYYRQGDYDSAIKYSQQSIFLDPTQHVPYVTLYCINYDQSKWKECIDWVEKSIKITPTFGQSHYIKSICHFNLGEYVESAKEYKIGMLYDIDNNFKNELPFSKTNAGINITKFSCELLLKYYRQSASKFYSKMNFNQFFTYVCRDKDRRNLYKILKREGLIDDEYEDFSASIGFVEK